MSEKPINPFYHHREENINPHLTTKEEDELFQGEHYEDKIKRIVGDGHDPVLHPNHYTSHPSGVECIQITEHMNFNLGNAVKYIWRSDLKDDAIVDLEKAKFYIEREIELRRKRS